MLFTSKYNLLREKEGGRERDRERNREREREREEVGVGEAERMEVWELRRATPHQTLLFTAGGRGA